MEQSSAGHGVPKIMVFRPTWEEFKDFNKFILQMEAQGAHKAGLAKVIPPPEWKPCKDEYDMDAIGRIKIPAPICQVVTGKQGLYQQINIQKKAMTVREFRELAESERYRTPLHGDYEELERKYWKNVTFVSPIYGADVSGSLTDPDVDEWNINRLGSILDYVNTDYGISIEGVNTAYLYFGMWKTTFAWHTEDMDLYSINFLHFGAPKSWYSIPPEHGRRLERLANGFFSSNYKSCPAYLRHKMTLISPQILKQYSIPYNKITQEAGEIMVTFPYGYHAGFNHGFNCAESTNFASPRWVEYGKRTVHCHCRKDMVKISMDTFVKRFQPDRYKLWITGKDIGPHPEDPNKLYAASAPSIDDILCNKNNEDVPETYLEAVEKREAKRHPIHKKKIFDKDEFEAKLKELVPVDDNDDESVPDEETIEVMKDIWIKADESDDPDFSLDDEFPSKSKKKSKAKTKRKDKPKKKIERKKSTELFSPKKLPTPAPYSSLFAGESALQVQKVLLPSAGTKLLNFRIPKTAHDVDSSTPKRNYDDAFESPVSTYSSSPLDAPSTSSAMKPGTGSNLRHYQEVNRRNFSNWGQSMRKAISDSLATYNETLKTTPSKEVKTEPHVIESNAEAMPSVIPDRLLETAQTLAKLKAATSVTITVQSAAETASKPPTGVVTPIVSIDPVKPTENTANQKSSPERQMTWFFPSPEEGMNYWSQMNKGRGTSVTSSNAEQSKVTQSRAGPAREDSDNRAPILKLEADLGSTNQGDACRGPPVLMRQDREKSPREGAAHVEAERRKARKQKSPRSRKLSEVPGSSSTSWAPSLAFLWQRSNVNLRKEADFNFFGSQVEPFCAICALFTEPRHLKCEFESTYWRESESIQMQSHAQVWVNEENFWPRRNNMHRKNEGRNGWEFQSSALLRCSQCRLCVHAKCYGQAEPSHKGAWMCQRCQEKDLQAMCSLCLWRGGALKRTTDGRWAHISCALTIPEVTFGDPVRREPIHLERLDPERRQLPCYYCQDLGPQRTRGSGACIRCSTGRCAHSFHPMCGWAAGVKFIDGGFNQTIRTKCTCHRAERHNSSPSHLRIRPPVAVDDTVLAPHLNGGYFYARIVQSKEEEFYWLDFMDGSTSMDTFPEDIVDFDCVRNGPPAVNSRVKVKWTDGLIYDGIYRGSNMKIMYMVRFQNGMSRYIEREMFYSSREDLPKSVRDQMM